MLKEAQTKLWNDVRPGRERLERRGLNVSTTGVFPAEGGHLRDLNNTHGAGELPLLSPVKP